MFWGTCADSSGLERAVGFRPNTSIEDGTRLSNGSGSIGGPSDEGARARVTNRPDCCFFELDMVTVTSLE
jgi:hypothetical protein